MEYNTQRDKLLMSEYGRHIQTMVDHCMTIEDDDVRQDVAEGIIEVMGQLNPGLRNVEDYRHKLWDHLFIMSDFKLQVNSPYPIPDREIVTRKPAKVDYPENKIRYRHYGRYILSLMEKAAEMEDEEKKQAFSVLIASFMKLLYRNYNNKDSVSDEQIRADLKRLSNGALEVEEGVPLNMLDKPGGGSSSGGGRRRNKQQHSSRSGGHRRKSRGSHGRF